MSGLADAVAGGVGADPEQPGEERGGQGQALVQQGGGDLVGEGEFGSPAGSGGSPAVGAKPVVAGFVPCRLLGRGECCGQGSQVGSGDPGWSVGATWRGIRVRDLLREAGVTDFTEVIVRSIQTTTKPKRMFGQARLNPSHALHPDTLLATEVNGERLHLDHGYPVRLIAPNNPGIMQTKWVEELWVR